MPQCSLYILYNSPDRKENIERLDFLSNLVEKKYTRKDGCGDRNRWRETEREADGEKGKKERR